MGIHVNAGPIGTVIKVPTLEPGEVSAQEVKLGQAGRVRMPNGTVITCGGELLRNALRNGGVQIDEHGNAIVSV